MLKTECPRCLVMFENPRNNMCCSRACANKRIHSLETKEKISRSLKNNKNPRIRKLTYEKIERKCLECEKTFIIPSNKLKRYCSLKCGTKKCGGYREFSGRSNSGHYKGIYCASTYELAWVIYRLDHNLSCNRFETTLERNGVKYIPDFLDDNLIIEIKGYYTPSVDIKCDIARSYGYDIVVKYKEDLATEFEWVKNTYHTKKFETLYDNYKPKYEYICDTCNLSFYRDKKIKDISKKKYCTRGCACKAAAIYFRHNK